MTIAQTTLAPLQAVLALQPADNEREQRAEAAMAALSPNTRRAYGHALKAWSRWAAVHDVDALSPRPAQLRDYLLERFGGGGAPMLKLTLAALRKAQGLAGVELTARDQLVVDTARALVQEAADKFTVRQAPALTSDELAAIRACACQQRTYRNGLVETPEQARRRGLVDIALCRVLSDAGLRRSEAAALVWEDFTRWGDGSGRLTVRRSKTDAGARTVYVTPAAVAALEDIRRMGASGDGSIFGLSAPSISRRIKAAAAAAGLGEFFSGHSGRVGMARRMAKAGAPTHEIMAQGRWKTAGMVETYTREEEAGRAARWLS